MNKKVIIYCALAVMLASCGGKKTSGEEAAVEDSAPHSELNLSPELVSHLDSIAGIQMSISRLLLRTGNSVLRISRRR